MDVLRKQFAACMVIQLVKWAGDHRRLKADPPLGIYQALATYTVATQDRP
jgi:hypothetical protein